MKTVNWSKIGVIVVITLVVGVIASVIFSFATCEGTFNSNMMILGLILYVFIAAFVVSYITKSVFKKQAEKTMETASNQGINGSTFHSTRALIRIDEENKKVAYVSVYNPKELFLLDPKQIHDAKADYIKGPLGGTSYVYFQFYYGKQKLRFPTFLSNQAYMIKSAEVQTGISKAETYRDILKQVSAK